MPNWPITGPFGVLLQELSSELYRVGLTLLIHQRSPDEDLGQVFSALTPTAVVAIGEMSKSDVEFAARRGIAVTPFMGSVAHQTDISALKQSEIGELQAQHLLSYGHQSLAYVLPANTTLDWFSLPRLEEAKRVAEAAGADFREVRLPLADADATRDLLIELVRHDVTGVCAYNDEVALALLLEAAGQGLAVPKELSIIGVDDSPLSVLIKPKLTTIGFDLASEAQRLARVLLQHDEDNGAKPVLSSLLAVRDRETVGKPISR